MEERLRRPMAATEITVSGSTAIGPIGSYVLMLLTQHKIFIHTTGCYAHEIADHMLIYRPDAGDSGLCLQNL
jgi:hypothetical protein